MSDQMRDVLFEANNPDNVKRKRAEEALQNFRQMNFPYFLLRLSQELAAQDAAPQVRTMAGLVLKNNVDSPDVRGQWMTIPPGDRHVIKETLLSTLLGSYAAGHTAAQAIAQLAVVELQQREWQDLVPTLVRNMEHPSPDTRRATLDALGYLCDALRTPEFIPDACNDILSAIMHGLRADEPDIGVQLAAAGALQNALEFLDGPFNSEREDDRNFIMTNVCGATQSDDERLQKAALECLVKIAEKYYPRMGPYMEAASFITCKAIKDAGAQPALQGIEFWSTICEEEIYLNELAAAAQAANQPLPFSGFHIRNSLGFFSAVLLQTLTRQEDHQTADTWNISMAAGTCLDLVARCAGNDIIQFVVPWVLEHIQSEDWHLREAALFAFGSILEGVDSAAIGELINSGLGIFASLMDDPHSLVSESAGWTIGRICNYHAEAVSPDFFAPLINALGEGLGKPPRVAANCCWALNNLAESCELEEGEERPYPLEEYYEFIISRLLAASIRDDGDEFNLRGSAYTALIVCVQTAPDWYQTCMGVVFEAFTQLMARLDATFGMSILNAADQENQADLQSLICGVLQTITAKVKDKIAPFAEQLISLYLRVFECSQNRSSATVHEETLLAVGGLAGAIKSNFVPYMAAFQPHLIRGLRNSEAYQVCTIAVGVVGDLCRALKKAIAPFCPEIMSVLFADLQNDELHKDVKPAILAALGDVALAIEEHYGDWLQNTMEVLGEASKIQLDQSYDANAIFMNTFRESIFEAYTGIFQGMKSVGQPAVVILVNYVPAIIAFMRHVYEDQYRSRELTNNMVGVLGDMTLTLEKHEAMVRGLRQDFVQPLIREVLTGDDPDARETAGFTQMVYRQALS